MSLHDALPTLLEKIEQRQALNLRPALGDVDCVVIVTNHSNYDWTIIRESKVLFVDTRNVIGLDR
jgi:UDP-N-acetyl-D-mannosaminuronate dehydrogenase